MAGYIVLAIFAALVIGVFVFVNRIFGPRVDKFVNSLPLGMQVGLAILVLVGVIVLLFLVGR